MTAPNPQTQAPPTVDQLLNLVARAEQKALTPAEGDRLRAGLQILADQYPGDIDSAVLVDGMDLAEIRRKYSNLQRTAWRWKHKAQTTTPRPTGGPSQPATPVAPAEQVAQDALRRVITLAQRWSHIPAKRTAAAAVLATIKNRDRSA